MKHNLQRKQDNAKAVEMQVVMPLELGIAIEVDEPVRLLIEMTERLDYRELYAAYDRPARADEATPKQLFQLVVLGFMSETYSLRKLERACKRDICFMYLLRGKRAPDHSRFGSFIKDRLQGRVAEGLFYQLVKELEARGEVAFKHLFVDGTKTEANANRYSFVWAKAVSKKYPGCMNRWADHWDCISPMFKFSREVRKVIYTTNAIESLNSGYRRLNRNRSVFPAAQALLKALYLATFELTKKWTMPLRNWGVVYAELAIMYPDRLTAA